MEADGVKAPAASFTDHSDFSAVGHDLFIEITFRFTFTMPEQNRTCRGWHECPGIRSGIVALLGRRV